MLTALFVCSLSDDLFGNQYNFLVGVDLGGRRIIKKKMMMDMAIGDFDSVNPQELEKIKQNAKHVVVLKQQKDDSDSEAAVKLWIDCVDKIVMIGALGGRLDHQYVNLQLMFQHPKIHLMDHKNHMFIAQTSLMIERDDYTYLSLFALEFSVISLDKVKYPLNNQSLLPTDRYTLSNEFLNEPAQLEIKQGKLLIIKSKDK